MTYTLISKTDCKNIGIVCLEEYENRKGKIVYVIHGWMIDRSKKSHFRNFDSRYEDLEKASKRYSRITKLFAQEYMKMLEA